MPLIIKAITEPDGSAITTHTVYIVAGSGTSGYFRFPGQVWDALEINWRETTVPDRDFARLLEPPKSQLAEFVDKGYVQVYDTTLPGLLTPDQIRNYV